MDARSTLKEMESIDRGGFLTRWQSDSSHWNTFIESEWGPNGRARKPWKRVIKAGLILGIVGNVFQ